MKKTIIIILIVLVAGALIYLAKTAVSQDTASPRVISTDPRSGADNVATNASVHAYFSEPMDPSTVTTNTFTVADDGGSTVPGEVVYANQAAAFVPFEHMDELSTYTATVSGSVTDKSGNNLGSDYSWSFQTASD